LENFFRLPVEKQNIIIDAALKCFDTNGYKKSSTSDIAIGAGISKSLIFHYFGTKKTLYLYLMDLCGKIFVNEFNEKFDNTVTDFFDRIMLSIDIKISVMKKHPEILSFLASMYYENDEEVKEEIKANLAKDGEIRSKIAFDGMDTSKFKDGIDPKLVMKMLVLLGEGYVSQPSIKSKIDIETLYKEFDEYIKLLKSNFYKEEYSL